MALHCFVWPGYWPLIEFVNDVSSSPFVPCLCVLSIQRSLHIPIKSGLLIPVLFFQVLRFSMSIISFKK